MSERIKGFTVALTHNMRSEEIEKITSMIMLIKGVEGVDLISTDPSEAITSIRVKNAVRDQLFKIIDEL